MKLDEVRRQAYEEELLERLPAPQFEFFSRFERLIN